MATASAPPDGGRVRDFASFHPLLQIEDRRTGRYLELGPNAIQWYIRRRIVAADVEQRPCRLIILKARRAGCSTIIQATLAHRAFTRRFSTSVTIAHDAKTAAYLHKMTREMYDRLPRWARTGLTSESRGLLLALKNGSELRVETAKNLNAGRGTGLRGAHCSEAAHWPHPRTIMRALRQSIPREPGTFLAVESTPNGEGNYFHSMWNRAKNGAGDYEPLFFPWYAFTEYSLPAPDWFLGELTDDERRLLAGLRDPVWAPDGLTLDQLWWRRLIIDGECEGDFETFQQEYPLNDVECFLASGTGFFAPRVINAFFPKEPLAEGRMEAEQNRRRGGINPRGWIRFVRKDPSDPKPSPLKVWELPQPGARYVAFMDLAGGVTDKRREGFDLREDADDFNVLAVVNCHTQALAALWRARMDTDAASAECYSVARRYHWAVFAPEMTGGRGIVAVHVLQTLGYPNIYRRREQDQSTPHKKPELGWETTGATRALMLDVLREHARTAPDLCRSADLKGEMKSFVWNAAGKPEAGPNAHDDVVMACAGAFTLGREFAQARIVIPKRPSAQDADRSVAAQLGGKRAPVR